MYMLVYTTGKLGRAIIRTYAPLLFGNGAKMTTNFALSCNIDSHFELPPLPMFTHFPLANTLYLSISHTPTHTHAMYVSVSVVPSLKVNSPEVCCILLGDSERVSSVGAGGEHSLQLGQHVREDERELGEAAPLGAGLVVDLILGILEEPHRLFALVHEVLHEEAEKLVIVEKGDVLLVALEHGAQVLVRVGEDVQDERRAVL